MIQQIFDHKCNIKFQSVIYYIECNTKHSIFRIYFVFRDIQVIVKFTSAVNECKFVKTHWDETILNFSNNKPLKLKSRHLLSMNNG